MTEGYLHMITNLWFELNTASNKHTHSLIITHTINKLTIRGSSDLSGHKITSTGNILMAERNSWSGKSKQTNKQTGNKTLKLSLFVGCVIRLLE